MARLDRLSATRDLAQLGAVLGREFSYELLHTVSPLDETTLQQGLAQLVDAELVYQRGLPPHSRYMFKHALIQEAAYQSLLRSTRQRYHQRTAQMLEAQFPETVETQPELVAQHYTEAGLAEHAIPYWQRAAQRARARSAHVEAIGHLTKGLEVLQALRDTPERAQQELALQMALGPTLLATKGQAAPEVGHTFNRARELCQQVGEASQLFFVVHGLMSFHFVRAEYKRAHELAEQLLSLAQRLQDAVYLVEAHHVLGQSLCCLGDFTAARAHFERSTLLYDPQRYYAQALRSGPDPAVFCLSLMSHALCHLGYLDQALVASRKAVALAQELSSPFSLAIALAYAAMFHQFRREPRAVHEQTAAAIALCTEQKFAYYLAWGTTMQ